MPFSTFSANKVLDCYLRGISIVAPARVWVSLHTGDPGGAGANEVTLVQCPAYERVDPSDGGAIASGFDAASGKATDNVATLVFPEHDGASSITVTHIGLWDAATSGNLLMSGALETARTLLPTDELSIRAGDLDCLVT
jgi:hypothetical protein